MILVGYHVTDGYKIFEQKIGQVVVIRNVVVDEIANWNWEKKEPEEPRIMLEEDKFEDMKLTSYSDADWCGDKFDRRSTTRYIFFLGITPIS